MNMKKAEVITLPAGLSGVMDYSHIKVGEYPVKHLKEGYKATVVVQKSSPTSIEFYIEHSDNISIDGFALFKCIELAEVFEKTIYYKNK